MGIVPSGILSEAQEQTLINATASITLGGRDPFEYGVGFRGPKRAITAMLNAMLERADGESLGGKLYTKMLSFGPDSSIRYGGVMLSSRFEHLSEDAPAHFVSGGRFLSNAWDGFEGFEPEYKAFFQELLSLVPELEGCVCIQDSGDFENWTYMYFYSQAGSNEVIARGIQMYTYASDENAVRHEEDSDEADVESDGGEDDWGEDWDEEDYTTAVPLKPERIEAQFQECFDRPKLYFETLLYQGFHYALQPVYRAKLKNTELFDRPAHIETVHPGDTLFLCSAPGERDNEVGIGAPCVAVCSPAGSLGVLNTGTSEHILYVTAEQASLAVTSSGDLGSEINPSLKAHFTAKALAVKPLSQMRRNAKRPQLEVEIVPDASLLGLCLQPVEDSPVLTEYLCRLRDKLCHA